MALRGTLSLLLPLLLAACGGKSADDYRADAQKALDGGDAAGAQTAAEEGLKSAGSDKAAAWRLEQIRLEALAKGGKGGQVAAELERLAAAYPQQVTAALYRAMADRVKVAGDRDSAIDILAAGDKRFPDDPAFKTAIEELKTTGVSPEEVEKLKALGYL
jgi:hypothetical protein